MAASKVRKFDNPFDVASKDSTESLTNKVTTLQLTRSCSFPDVRSSSHNYNLNCNDDRERDGSSTSKAKRSSHEVNPFEQNHGQEQAMDTETASGPGVVSQTSNSLFKTPKSSLNSTLNIPSGSSPLSLRRRTRSSSRTSLPNLSLSQSKQNLKPRTDSKLKQNFKNLFKLDDYNLSQLVATQSHESSLKMTIRRQPLQPKKSKSSSVVLGDLGNENLISKIENFGKQASACLQLGAQVAPLPQRTNRRSTRRLSGSPHNASSNHEAPPAISGLQDHVDNQNQQKQTHVVSSRSHAGEQSDISNQSLVDSNISINSSSSVLIPSGTPVSNPLNQRLPLSPRESESSKIIKQHLRSIREATDKILHEKIETQNFNTSKNLNIVVDDTGRNITVKNNSGTKQLKNKVQFLTHDQYKNSRDINPFLTNSPSDNHLGHTNTEALPNSKGKGSNKSKPKSSTNSKTPLQEATGVYDQAETVLDQYKLYLSKEMVTRLHVQQLEIQLRDKLYPLWCTTYSPPLALINSEEKVQDLIRIRTELATKMLESNLDFYRMQLNELMAKNEDLLTTLNAIYKTPKGLGFNLNQALDDATISANRQRDKKLTELNTIMDAIKLAPEAALWRGIPADFTRPPRATRVVDDRDTPTPSTSGGSPQHQYRPRTPSNPRRQNNRAQQAPRGPGPQRPTSRPQGSPQQRNRSRSKPRNNQPRINKRKQDVVPQQLVNVVARTVQNVLQDYI